MFHVETFDSEDTPIPLHVMTQGQMKQVGISFPGPSNLDAASLGKKSRRRRRKRTYAKITFKTEEATMLVTRKRVTDAEAKTSAPKTAAQGCAKVGEYPTPSGNLKR